MITCFRGTTRFRPLRVKGPLVATSSPTITSSSYKITRCLTPASSVDDINIHRPTSPSIYINITDNIDPQFLSYLIPNKKKPTF
jgi:hypothetical protein